MKVSSARAMALLAWLSCTSCAPAPLPERAPVAPLAIGPSTPGRPAAAVHGDAAPKPPGDLALLVRVGDAEQLAREVVSILPPSAAAAVAVLDPKQLLGMLLGQRLGEVVDLGQSIDVASVGSGTSTSFVVSMAVKQEAEGKLGEGLVLREEGPLLHIGTPDEPAAHEARLHACAFTPAVGRATTRLVCASNDATLKAGAAYLARNVAGEPLDADVRVSLPGRVLRDKRDSTAKAVSEAASAQLGNELVERFVEEIERVDVDLRFQGARVELGMELRLAGRESMLARVLVPRSVAAVPPPAFHRLPGDSLVALHTVGATPEDIAPLRKALADSIEATLVQDGYTAERTHALRERLESLLLTGGPLVLGMGVVGGREGTEKALAALQASDPARPGAATRAARPADQARLEAQARSALQPWLLVHVDEPPETWTQGLRDVVRRAEDADRTRSPGSRSSTPRDPDGDHVDLRVGALDPTLKLPRDALHLEVLLVPRTKGKRPTRKAHLFVVPKGATTWLGYCEDASVIASKLRLAIDDTTETGTLGRSADATELRTRAAHAAGLSSIGGLPSLVAKSATGEDLRTAAASAARIVALGVHGAENVTWSAQADTKPGSVKLSVRAHATRQSVVDIVRMLKL